MKRAAAHAVAAPDAPLLQQRLRQANLRATPARLAVLGHLLRAPAPVSHAELVQAVAGEGFDRATLYRNLIDLTRAGLVRRVDRGDHVWRFAVDAHAHHDRTHPHFVCVTCGDIECLPSADLAFKSPIHAPQAVRAAKVEVQLRGVCDRC